MWAFSGGREGRTEQIMLFKFAPAFGYVHAAGESSTSASLGLFIRAMWACTAAKLALFPGWTSSVFWHREWSLGSKFDDVSYVFLIFCKLVIARGVSVTPAIIVQPTRPRCDTALYPLASIRIPEQPHNSHSRASFFFFFCFLCAKYSYTVKQW